MNEAVDTAVAPGGEAQTVPSADQEFLSLQTSEMAGDGADGAEAPASDTPDPAASEETPVAAPDTVTVDGREFTMEQLSELVTKGETAHEAQEQAALYQNLLKAAETPEGLDRIIGELTALKAEQFGAPPSTSLELPEDDLLTDTEIALKKVLTTQNSELARLRSQLDRQALALEEYGKTIKDLEPFHKEVISTQQAKAEQAAVKQKLGLDVTPADIAAAKKLTGVNDPVGAVAAARFKQGAQPTPPATPTSRERVPDLEKLPADEVFRLLNSGVVTS